jgi:hypothetical protein
MNKSRRIRWAGHVAHIASEGECENARRDLKVGLKVKVKAELSLCLIKHYAMKTYRGVEV